MSLYNMVNGYSAACIFFMPMLGRKPDDYPRFRDCFITKDNEIAIYTRVGGNNRNQGYGEEALYKDENFVRTFDDDFDNTYGTYVFNVPAKWKDDFDKLRAGKPEEVSDEYIALLKEFFPRLDEEGKLREIFRPCEEGENT